jgi:Uma2 family endonuclease
MLVIPVQTESSSVIGPRQGEWTYADWENLPDDDKRYEVIDGVLYMSTSPSYFHQWIIRRLDHFLGIPAEEQGLAFGGTAPIGVLMPGCDPVQPDFVLVKAEHATIIHDRRIRGVPDLIIEVLSPGNADYDISVKKAAYEKAGVPEYAIVDSQQRHLRLFRLGVSGQYGMAQVFGAEDTVSFACVSTISFRVGGLFEGSPDTTV